MSISIKDLMHLTLQSPHCRYLMNATSMGSSSLIQKYTDILLESPLAEDHHVSTFEEYQICFKYILDSLHIDEQEYQMLQNYRPQIDSLVLQVFERLTS